MGRRRAGSPMLWIPGGAGSQQAADYISNDNRSACRDGRRPYSKYIRKCCGAAAA
jgi:hypothetical protein